MLPTFSKDSVSYYCKTLEPIVGKFCFLYEGFLLDSCFFLTTQGCPNAWDILIEIPAPICIKNFARYKRLASPKEFSKIGEKHQIPQCP